MNWNYLAVEALLPLVWALAATLLGGALWAFRLHRGGGSSRVALGRLLRALGLIFPAAFLLASLWGARHTLKGLAGVVVGRPVDQRAMGLLRAKGEHFLLEDPAKAAYWYRKAAEGRDADGQLLLARAMLRGYGLPRDPVGASNWAQAAANQGRPDAMLLAGDLANPGEAWAWYLRALPLFRQQIQAGDADACLNYGLMYTTGKGVERDRTEGLAWMLVARHMGLDPYKGVIILLSESALTKSQRAEATQRAAVLQKTLPPRGPSSTSKK